MASLSRSASLRFKAFKYTIYALLTFNVGLFMIHATLHEALDSLGWVILLAAFEYETRTLAEPYHAWYEQAVLWGLQIVGYAIALFACVSYFLAAEWLDFANSVTWLLVCLALTYDVYVPGEYGGVEWRLRNGIKICLYGLLCLYAAIWGYQGLGGDAGIEGVLDFYDAALWIVCFLVVELNVFTHETDMDLQPAIAD